MTLDLEEFSEKIAKYFKVAIKFLNKDAQLLEVRENALFIKFGESRFKIEISEVKN